MEWIGVGTERTTRRPLLAKPASDLILFIRNQSSPASESAEDVVSPEQSTRICSGLPLMLMMIIIIMEIGRLSGWLTETDREMVETIPH